MGFVQHMQKSIQQNRTLWKNHTSIKQQLADKNITSGSHQELNYKEVSQKELADIKAEIQLKAKREKQIRFVLALIIIALIVYVYFSI